MTLRYRCNALSTELPRHMDRWSIVSFQLLRLIAHCEDQISLISFMLLTLIRVSGKLDTTLDLLIYAAAITYHLFDNSYL